MRPHESLSRTCWLICAVLLAFLGLTGCQTLERIGGDTSAPAIPIELAPAAKPTYRPGQVFVYNRDRLRRVAWVGKGEILWRNQEAPLYRTSEHFFLPRIYQDYPDRTLRREFTGDPAALWPLAVGKEVAFIERRMTERKQTQTVDETTRHWLCSVDDARVSQTPAGSFDSFRVTCRSYREAAGSNRDPSPVQVVRWDYAPIIGHYVRRESWLPRSGRRHLHTLSAALPASLVTPQRVDALMQRLANETE